MSLLLDALNRAGKDKAAAADAAKTENDWPAISLMPQAPEPEASPAPSSAPQAAAALPTLPAIEPAPEIGLSLEPVARSAQTDAPPALAMVPPTVAPVTPSVPVLAADLAPEPMSPAVPPAPPAPAAVQPKPAAPPPERVAQTMVRAKAASPASSSRPRLLALGGVAGLLAVGLGSVLLGWVDPMALLNPRAGSGSSGPMAAATLPPGAAPAPATAPTQAEPAPVTAAPAFAPPPPLTATAADTPVLHSTAKRKTAAPGAGASTAAGSQTMPARNDGAARRATKARAQAVPPKLPEPSPPVTAKPAGPSQLELGYAALTQGRMTEAVTAYNGALAENPEERDALLGLAYIAHQSSREEEARDLYKRVLRQEPGNASARAGLLVQTLINDSEDVSGSSREVAEQNPGSALAQSVLGHSLVRQGRLPDALLAFQRAHALEPGVALHAFNVAVAFDRLRNYGPARTFYERALALSRQNGGEANSGISHAVISNRLQDLLAAKVTDGAPAR